VTIFAVACGTESLADRSKAAAEEVRQETRAAAQAAEELILREREEYMTQIEEKMKVMGARIDELQANPTFAIRGSKGTKV
jgi:hypothetical protein